jgi:glycosyltransferase involved in cell wall biosynthesis
VKIWMVCEGLTEVCVPNVTVLEIRKNLDKLGHEVLLFCPSTERNYADPDDCGIYFVPTVGVRGLRELLYQFFLALGLIRCRMRSKPDWIYCRPVITMISPVLMSRVIRVPHILHLSGDMAEILRTSGSGGLVRALYAVLERINFKLSARVVVETSSNKVIRQRRHHMPEGRVVVVPNGANVGLFKPMDLQQARQRLGIQEDCLCVGFVGNLTRYQGLSYLVNAAPLILEELPNALFLVVGDGEAKDEVIELVEKKGLSERFIFTGVVPYELVPEYIAASDVCVAPRVRQMCEKTGISLLKMGEYLACERPMVASDIDGVGPVLREANAGIPVPLEDSRGLAEAVMTLLKDKSLREEMGRNGRKFVMDNLSWEIAAKRLLQVAESVAERKTEVSGSGVGG